MLFGELGLFWKSIRQSDRTPSTHLSIRSSPRLATAVFDSCSQGAHRSFTLIIMLRETPDRVPRVVSVYMQEQPIPAVKNVESPWNKLPVQSIYRAIDTHQSLSTTKVAKNIEEYGSWLLAQKSKLD